MKKLLLYFCIAIAYFGLSGQDVHFSQFYSAPLTVNPAFTGYFNGNYRIGLNYRNQYASFNTNGTTFSTFAAYGDIVAKKNKRRYTDWFGAGLQVVNDKAGDGNLSTTKLTLSGAFHKSLDQENKFLISIGFAGGWVRKSVDYTQFYFDNQWQETGFDIDLPNLEPNAGAQVGLNSFDLQTGGLVSYNNPNKFEAYLGGSVGHLTRPLDSFSPARDNSVGLRTQLSAGANIYTGTFFNVRPRIYYSRQKAAQELNGGMNFVMSFDKNTNISGTKLYLGGWYRAFAKELIAVAGVEVQRIKILTNYDINIGNLGNQGSNNAAWEVSLTYLVSKQKRTGTFCPSF